MKIPKKISPDRIKDSIVEVRYTTSLPFEVALGWFFKSIGDSYNYSNRPPGLLKNQLNSLIVNNNQDIQFAFNLYLFHNEKIKIELKPNSLIFNCLNEYIGWENYFLEIKKFIDQISKANVINTFNRIGFRYISHYPEIDLRNCVKYTFTFGMPQVISNSFGFRTEFIYENLKVILNLNNNLPAVTNNFPNEVKPLSIIDLDVIDERLSIESGMLENLYNKIDIIHNREKEIFFNLLKSEFLQTLNPEY